MDSLERLFYSVAAMAAGLAVMLFGLYFDIGAMMLAAFQGPGAFREWAYQKNLRNAELQGLPGEIKPDESNRPGYFVVGDEKIDGLPFGAYNGPPRFSLDHKLKRERMYLVQKGFTDKDFLEMEALFRADKAHLRGMFSVDQMVIRGDALSAYEELEAVISRTNPRNLRAMGELLGLRGQLMAQLNAPADDLYDHVMQELALKLRVVELEIQGYTGVPQYAQHLAMARFRKAQIEQMMASFRTNRSKALAVFGSGAFGSDYMDPETARLVKASVARAQQHTGLPAEEAAGIVKLVETRADNLRRARENGDPLSPLGP